MFNTFIGLWKKQIFRGTVWGDITISKHKFCD